MRDSKSSMQDASKVQTEATTATDGAIRPFEKVHFPDNDLDDLKRRIKATRWPDKEVVKDYSQGIKLDVMKALAQHWANDYDWRRIENKLNSYPQFITTIDGVDIHFIHGSFQTS